MSKAERALMVEECEVFGVKAVNLMPNANWAQGIALQPRVAGKQDPGRVPAVTLDFMQSGCVDSPAVSVTIPHRVIHTTLLQGEWEGLRQIVGFACRFVARATISSMTVSCECQGLSFSVPPTSSGDGR